MGKNVPLVLAIAALLAVVISVAVINNRLQQLENVQQEGVSLEASDFEDIPLSPGPAISFSLPAVLTFAGVTVPLHIQDVKERLDK